MAIIGAGPYGLSIAAHLAATGVRFRIFGRAMQTWLTRMPAGMSLKSEGFATTLYDPAGRFTLAHYCAEQEIPYRAVGLPVPLDVFAAYGQEFQRRFVPGLEPQDVVCLSRARPTGTGFDLTLADGTALRAKKIILATGINAYAWRPAVLAGLPASLASHSSDHASYAGFAGRDVTVLGAGASALDTAALLAQAGARVRLLARTKTIGFHAPPQARRSWRQRLRAPRSGLGMGWKSWLCSTLPGGFRLLPAAWRHQAVRRHLGPVGCWFVRDMIEGRVTLRLGETLVGARPAAGRLLLTLGSGAVIATDHVVAGTGFRTDLGRLAFLDPELRRAIAVEQGAPVLSRAFETTVAGLFVVGAPAATAFGPLLRFACGARYVARALTRRLT